MAKAIDEWPWNTAWPWLLMMAPVLLFLGVIWTPIGSCASYEAGYQGDTSCYLGPPAGYDATWAMTAVSLLIVAAFASGLARALYRRARRTRPKPG